MLSTGDNDRDIPMRTAFRKWSNTAKYRAVDFYIVDIGDGKAERKYTALRVYLAVLTFDFSSDEISKEDHRGILRISILGNV